MGEASLTPEEEKLKGLLISLKMVSQDDIGRVAADIRLIRRYGGTVDLKQRLIDINLVHERQIDAIERSLPTKKKETPKEAEAAAAGASVEARALRDAPNKAEPGKFIDVSRLTGAHTPEGHAPAQLKNLKLGARPPSGQAPSVHAPAQTDSGTAPSAAEPAPATKRGGFVPSWQRKREEEPEPSPGSADGKNAVPSSDVQTIEEQEERIKRVIRHIIKSRMHEAVLDYLIKRRMNIVEPAEVAKGLALKERDVRDMLDDLRHAGVIKDIGTHPYALSPGKKDLDELKFFFKLWQDGAWHSKILTWLLEHEKH
ncbi:MAG TPA: hypothetical protein ENN09_05145 [Planctomycetes bacterium]|nr:hypothetical protein [Planctomycetota bacterium]